MTLATVSTRSPRQAERKPRPTNDWFVEPREAVTALLREEAFWGTVWDPCCGQGTIPDAFSHIGLLTVVGSDLVDRANGRFLGLDFLAATLPDLCERTDHIVMNPPFALAREFIDKARTIARHKVAALCRLSFLEGTKRRPWFEATGLSRVWVFADRISMPPGELLERGEIERGGGAVAFAWFVWDRSHRGPPVIGWVSSRSAG